jgi:glucosamine kinase
VTIVTDIEVAYLDVFAPGEGYLVYAGTGSIAAFIDARQQFHRVGGRGGLLDDGGSGFWIAREALRHIWRTEDEQPGSWRKSAMAREVLEHVGGSDWTHTRQFIYGVERGEMGKLALAVAAAAGTDPPRCASWRPPAASSGGWRASWSRATARARWRWPGGCSSCTR